MKQSIFNSKYIEDHDTGCWIWSGNKRKDRLRRAHRLSWDLHNTVSLTPDQNLCHICDNPECVNPLHMYLEDQVLPLHKHENWENEARSRL